MTSSDLNFDLSEKSTQFLIVFGTFERLFCFSLYCPEAELEEGGGRLDTPFPGTMCSAPGTGTAPVNTSFELR